MIYFKNDYNAIGHKNIINAITKFALENNIGYGEDYHTKNAIKLIRKEIGNENADIYFLSGGTITNRIGLYQMLKPYEAIITVDSGHINVHETGAVESTGHKVLTCNGVDGKITRDEILQILSLHQDSHKVLPRAVYISNATEIGTIYSKKELEEISKVCKENNLYLFIDGARLGCALVANTNDVTIKDIAAYSDMFYIGGTKNGAPLGEALVITNEILKENFQYLLKNQGGLLAKGFMLGIIFEELFNNNLYFENAKNSVDKANKLREVFKKYNINEEYKNPTNQIFVRLTKEAFDKLGEKVLFEKWEDKDNHVIARFVTNFNTSDSDISNFEQVLSKL